MTQDHLSILKIFHLASITFFLLFLNTAFSASLYPKPLSIRLEGFNQGQTPTCSGTSMVSAYEHAFERKGYPVKLSLFYSHSAYAYRRNQHLAIDKEFGIKLNEKDIHILEKHGDLLPYYLWPEDLEGVNENHCHNTRQQLHEVSIIPDDFKTSDTTNMVWYQFHPEKKDSIDVDGLKELLNREKILTILFKGGFLYYFDERTGLIEPRYIEQARNELLSPHNEDSYHSVALVGYDDSLYQEYNFPAGSGAFIVQNSWNSDKRKEMAAQLSISDPRLRTFRLKIFKELNNLTHDHLMKYPFIKKFHLSFYNIAQSFSEIPQNDCDRSEIFKNGCDFLRQFYKESPIGTFGANLPGYYAIPYQFFKDIIEMKKKYPDKAISQIHSYPVPNYKNFYEQYKKYEPDHKVFYLPYSCNSQESRLFLEYYNQLCSDLNSHVNTTTSQDELQKMGSALSRLQLLMDKHLNSLKSSYFSIAKVSGELEVFKFYNNEEKYQKFYCPHSKIYPSIEQMENMPFFEQEILNSWDYKSEQAWNQFFQDLSKTESLSSPLIEFQEDSIKVSTGNLYKKPFTKNSYMLTPMENINTEYEILSHMKINLKVTPLQQNDSRIPPLFAELGQMHEVKNLVWSAVAKEKMNYAQAVEYCESLGNGVHLPTRTHWNYLRWAMGKHLIPDIKGLMFWSMTGDESKFHYAYRTNPENITLESDEWTKQFSVRCVFKLPETGVQL